MGASALLHIIDRMGGGGGVYLSKLFLPAFAAPRGESQHPVILSRETVPLTTKCVIFFKVSMCLFHSFTKEQKKSFMAVEVRKCANI
jgi:hypothetical protein